MFYTTKSKQNVILEVFCCLQSQKSLQAHSSYIIKKTSSALRCLGTFSNGTKQFQVLWLRDKKLENFNMSIDFVDDIAEVFVVNLRDTMWL